MRLKQVYCFLFLMVVSSAFAGEALSEALSMHRDRALPMTSVAQGVFYHAGQQAEVNGDNDGDIANIGFIVGDDCVAVIDTGGSPKIGRQLLLAVHDMTDKPVCYVINTHMHPDHVFGNAAFTQADTVFIAAARFPEALTARARPYLDRVRSTLDPLANADWIVLPQRTVKDIHELDLGNRMLRLRAWPVSHTNNDLTVFDEKTGTLWLGDLLFVDRVPALDGSITGWLQSLKQLRARTDIRHAIPGHGPPSTRWPDVLEPESEYLDGVRQGVEQALADGRSLRWAEKHVAQGARPDWLLFDDYHARNVTAAYTELDWSGNDKCSPFSLPWISVRAMHRDFTGRRGFRRRGRRAVGRQWSRRDRMA